MNDMDNTKTLAFVLGRERELALAELKAVLNRFGFCFAISRISGNIVFANFEVFSLDDAKKLIETLGGTIKIFQIFKYQISNISPSLSARRAGGKCQSGGEHFTLGLLEKLISDRREGSTNKFNLGLSWYNKNKPRDFFRFGLGLKKELKAKGFSVRFIESKEPELSTILSTKNKLDSEGIETGIFDDCIGTLLAVNNPYEWSKRDYDKPRSDKRSGMVPPKLARAMVNLALGEIENSKHEALNSKQIINSNDQNSQQAVISTHPRPEGYTLCPTIGWTEGGEKSQHDGTDEAEDLSPCENAPMARDDNSDVLVVDPFCGSGNILMEAIMLGCDVFGSDKNEKAVEATKANLSWLSSQYSVSSIQYPVSQADATKDDFINILNTKYFILNTERPVAVVTEPFLGEPKKFKPSMNAARGEYEKIKELYLQFLQNIVKLLNCSIVGEPINNTSIQQYDNPVVCLVFPLVETTEGKRYSLFSECVDEIKKMGYTQTRSNFIYGRDYQVVKREIALLKFEARNSKL